MAEAMGAKVQVVNPYDIPQVLQALDRAVKGGVSVVVSRAPCYLLASRAGETLFTPRRVRVDPELCNNCKICVDYFGCPAIHFKDDKVYIDEVTCVQCGMCLEVCKRGAIK
jgi:indolepyruvate ferredoxin oxidoreductase alpha subunit